MKTLNDLQVPANPEGDSDELHRWRNDITRILKDLSINAKTDLDSLVANSGISADFTIREGDGIRDALVDTSSAEVDVTLPPLKDSRNRHIRIINIDGTNNVVVTPDGTDKINSYNDVLELTEKWGWCELIGAEDQWVTIIGEYSSVYESISTTSINLNLAIGSWDDVLTLTGVPKGIYDFRLKGQHYVDRSGVMTNDINLLSGVGLTQGNNPADIETAYPYYCSYAGAYSDSVVIAINFEITRYDNSVGTSEIFYFKEWYTCTVQRTVNQYYSNGPARPIYIRMVRVG